MQDSYQLSPIMQGMAYDDLLLAIKKNFSVLLNAYIHGANIVQFVGDSGLDGAVGDRGASLFYIQDADFIAALQIPGVALPEGITIDNVFDDADKTLQALQAIFNTGGSAVQRLMQGNAIVDNVAKFVQYDTLMFSTGVGAYITFDIDEAGAASNYTVSRSSIGQVKDIDIDALTAQVAERLSSIVSPIASQKSYDVRLTSDSGNIKTVYLPDTISNPGLAYNVTEALLYLSAKLSETQADSNITFAVATKEQLTAVYEALHALATSQSTAPEVNTAIQSLPVGKRQPSMLVIQPSTGANYNDEDKRHEITGDNDTDILPISSKFGVTLVDIDSLHYDADGNALPENGASFASFGSITKTLSGIWVMSNSDTTSPMGKLFLSKKRCQLFITGRMHISAGSIAIDTTNALINVKQACSLTVDSQIDVVSPRINIGKIGTMAFMHDKDENAVMLNKSGKLRFITAQEFLHDNKYITFGSDLVAETLTENTDFTDIKGATIYTALNKVFSQAKYAAHLSHLSDYYGSYHNIDVFDTYSKSIDANYSIEDAISYFDQYVHAMPAIVKAEVNGTTDNLVGSAVMIGGGKNDYISFYMNTGIDDGVSFQYPGLIFCKQDPFATDDYHKYIEATPDCLRLLNMTETWLASSLPHSPYAGKFVKAGTAVYVLQKYQDLVPYDLYLGLDYKTNAFLQMYFKTARDNAGLVVPGLAYMQTNYNITVPSIRTHVLIGAANESVDVDISKSRNETNAMTMAVVGNRYQDTPSMYIDKLMVARLQYIPNWLSIDFTASMTKQVIDLDMMAKLRGGLELTLNAAANVNGILDLPPLGKTNNTDTLNNRIYMTSTQIGQLLIVHCKLAANSSIMFQSTGKQLGATLNSAFVVNGATYKTTVTVRQNCMLIFRPQLATADITAGGNGTWAVSILPYLNID